MKHAASGLAAISALALAASPAGAVDLADPAPVAVTFRNMCLADFPDVGSIGRKAIASGWVERKVTITGGTPSSNLSTSNLPRFFSWRGLTMVLFAAGDGMATSCQVSAPGSASVSLDDVVTALARSDPPALIKQRGGQVARWLVGDQEINASVVGKPRTISYVIRNPLEQTRS